MTKEKESTKAGFASSKYMKLLLLIIMALLLFGGPYVLYAMHDLAKLRFSYSAIGGAGSIVLGLLLLWYLIRAKIIT
jgi:hypothetical protein